MNVTLTDVTMVRNDGLPHIKFLINKPDLDNLAECPNLVLTTKHTLENK